MIGKKSWAERYPKLYTMFETAVFCLAVLALVCVIWAMDTYNLTPIT